MRERSAAQRDVRALIEQWDSAGNLAQSEGREGDGDLSTFSFHTAYFDPETMTSGRPRWSIEVRCVALWT